MTSNSSVGEIFEKKRETTGTSYDEVPYESYPFPQTHPRRLATIARLMGLVTADLDHCRVLELACSGGGNLIPMADQSPLSRFVGVDSSQVAIAEGNATIAALGLTNIELHHKNILEVGEDLGEFDYIIAHGVFSWVPPAVRQKILEICSRQLAPHGVAYISYNTNPGWRLRGTIRDVMRYRAQFFSKPEVKVKQSRALVNFLAKSVPAQGSMYGHLLNEELQLIQKSADYYLLHEFLEDENLPLYFHEFIELAQQAGLQYVGESEYSSMSVNNFGPEVSQMLRSLASDVVQMEQYMDFVRNRLFRQTLLCRKDVTLRREAYPAIIRDLFISSKAAPQVPVTNILANENVRFVSGACAMTSPSPLIKAVMLILHEHWPAYLSFEELMNSVRARLASVGWKSENSEEVDNATIEGMLLNAYSTTVADMTVQRWPMCLRPSKKPLGSPLARHQAKKLTCVTNLGHANVQINAFQAYVLSLLDGTRDRDALIDHLYESSKSELRIMDANGQLMTEKQQLCQVVGTVLDENLRFLAGNSLLLE